MNNEPPIVNRVAKSPIVTLDLEELRPAGERAAIDIKDQLFQGMILREKDFRDFVSGHDFGQYAGKHVAVFCSADAIVPTWAYMLLASELQPHAATVVFGDLPALEQSLYQSALAAHDFEAYRDKPVVVKGCSDEAVPPFAYVEAMRRLRPVAQKVMYGEPCSAVPVFRKKKAKAVAQSV